jgi:very-short-patch-repair endonuclease
MFSFRRRMPDWKKQKARELRKNMTPAEVFLWEKIRSKRIGFAFRRQAPMGGYIADFYCPSCKLVVEVDGGYHQKATDDIRDFNLSKFGFRTIRFSNEEVFDDIDRVVNIIRLACECD